jgi:hypothetical protein
MSALVIFSVDVRRSASFYELVLDASATTESSGAIRLTTGSDEVLIHSIPKKVAAGISISTPPAPRENSALKPVFEVQSLSRTLQRVEETAALSRVLHFAWAESHGTTFLILMETSSSCEAPVRPSSDRDRSRSGQTGHEQRDAATPS